MKKNVETFIACDCEYNKADVVLFGAPFDSTTSFRPGTRFAPSYMRRESFGLETYSPYLDGDLTDMKVFDSGDIELPFGEPKKALTAIRNREKKILSDGKFPVLIGGEHLVTLGAIKAVFEKFPDLHIIQFDAHADLREDYLSVKLSHACVMRRCFEILGKGRIHQFCIRSGDREEFRFAEVNSDMRKFDFKGLDELVERLKEEKAPVYLTIDLDCLDPSILPGTGTPEAGGVSFDELLKAVYKTCECNLVGADVNELNPMTDVSGVSVAVANKVLRELLIALGKK